MNTRLIYSIEEQVTDVLRSALIAGEYEPGSKMNESTLASNLGLSRTIIRRVLMSLYKEGLLNNAEGHGYYVLEPLNQKTKKMLLHIRSSIEKYAIRAFKKRASVRDYDELETILSRMNNHCKQNKYLEFIKADIDFHGYFVRLAGGDDLHNLWQPVVFRIHMHKGISKTFQSDVDEHALILNAMKNQDTKTAIDAILDNIA
ncbi:GntR family transcriptional regulator [Thalassotalea sp. PLHSN55]|uniref:GntR family transcriptional regulator n=1 Tax=Thalassotalea sp. PLHSN55 TaxID=3435888 RepID=UPI003F86A273